MNRKQLGAAAEAGWRGRRLYAVPAAHSPNVILVVLDPVAFAHLAAVAAPGPPGGRGGRGIEALRLGDRRAALRVVASRLPGKDDHAHGRQTLSALLQRHHYRAVVAGSRHRRAGVLGQPRQGGTDPCEEASQAVLALRATEPNAPFFMFFRPRPPAPLAEVNGDGEPDPLGPVRRYLDAADEQTARLVDRLETMGELEGGVMMVVADRPARAARSPGDRRVDRLTARWRSSRRTFLVLAVLVAELIGQGYWQQHF